MSGLEFCLTVDPKGRTILSTVLFVKNMLLTSKIRSMTPTWLWSFTCMSICKPPTVKDSCQPSKYERSIWFSFMFFKFYQLDLCNKIVLHLKIYNEASTKIIPPWLSYGYWRCVFID
jgi:hypothetical protein